MNAKSLHWELWLEKWDLLSKVAELKGSTMVVKIVFDTVRKITRNRVAKYQIFYIEKILKSAFLLSFKVSIFLPLFDILQLCNQDRRWVRPQFLVREHPQRKQVEDGAADGHDAGDIPAQQKVAHR